MRSQITSRYLKDQKRNEGFGAKKNKVLVKPSMKDVEPGRPTKWTRFFRGLVDETDTSMSLIHWAREFSATFGKLAKPDGFLSTFCPSISAGLCRLVRTVFWPLELRRARVLDVGLNEVLTRV